jgi:hypothetical protein
MNTAPAALIDRIINAIVDCKGSAAEGRALLMKAAGTDEITTGATDEVGKIRFRTANAHCGSHKVAEIEITVFHEGYCRVNAFSDVPPCGYPNGRLGVAGTNCELHEVAGNVERFTGIWFALA